jgi:hypothetical protein
VCREILDQSNLIVINGKYSRRPRDISPWCDEFSEHFAFLMDHQFVLYNNKEGEKESYIFPVECRCTADIVKELAIRGIGQNIRIIGRLRSDRFKNFGSTYVLVDTIEFN